MFEAEQICPYTGLRSFTEEESIYFKGREEEIDQATLQLQRNKFLMLTGASGDGKSSLIYAGIIPNARAGFLKSRYSQWCVADFRPERTPFQNLCKAIARELGIQNADTVQAELNHGFSAIIDLYKNSKRFLDTNSIAWQQSDEKQQAAVKREAANLVILVDQFEEFFTNPENYQHGVPSPDANLVLNLLLETARIALEEDLPVYVVFTMRSDYIGQCAAFRGLPEYIGFSQFFVPRLNRTQLQQVIEEPSVLSGNRITRRLAERLIHDLKEGVDQLPILQHALNQVWHAAENGREEMDLIHYAMVGGMPESELPEDQVERFNNWFADLPAHIKACYHEPSLQNVLDTHTNKLYEQAAAYYSTKTGKQIADAVAKKIIKTTFTCLTKIDQSRAVRNRMTLKEITDILGEPGVDSNEVGAVLDIFREPGNTFIRPFITEDPSSQKLRESDVLDITHESLIRNWRYLEQWAKEEFDNYTISQDFEQQLNRWVKSNKSKDYLLSIGPLTYFENWFNTIKPNAYWIARYLPEEIEADKKTANARQVLGNSREFISRSAKKHVVTRTVMRYGTKKIAAVLAVIAFITLSSFVVRNYFRKQNDNVLKSIRAESLEIANKSKLSPEFVVPLLTPQLMMGNLDIATIIEQITDKKQKIKIATAISTLLGYQGRYEPRNEILQSLSIADSLMEQLEFTDDTRELSEDLKLFIDYTPAVGQAVFFNPDKKLKDLEKRNAVRCGHWAKEIITRQPAGFTDISFLNLCLENAINHAVYTKDEIRELLKMISPFENPNPTDWLKKNFARDSRLVTGSFIYGLPFNGLYQELAYLYAATGDIPKISMCIDSLLQNQETFFENDYSTFVDNERNIAGVFYTYGQTNKLDSFVNVFCTKKNTTPWMFYNRLVSQGRMYDLFSNTFNFYAGAGGQKFMNFNLLLASDSMISFFNQKLLQSIQLIPSAEERNFTMSYVLKNQGCYLNYLNEVRGKPATVPDSFFARAVQYYEKLSPAYLNTPISVIGSSSSNMITVPRSFIFLYPDIRVPFHPYEPRSLVQFYYTGAFPAYLLEKGIFDSVYKEPGDILNFEGWLYNYQELMSSRDIFYSERLPANLLAKLLEKLKTKDPQKKLDLNVLYLHLADHAFLHKDSMNGIKYMEALQKEKLLNIFQNKNYFFTNGYSLELVGTQVANLAMHNRYDLASSIVNVFRKEANRSSLYGYASQLIGRQQGPKTAAERLLDSARAEMNRIKNPSVPQPNRLQVAMAMMYLNPEKNSREAYRIIKNSFNKFSSVCFFSKAYGMHGELYKAKQQMPSLASVADRTFLLWKAIEGYAETQPQKKEWEKYNDNQLIFTRRQLDYISEDQ